VVDDAIIDVENITRRLRLNRVAVEPRSAFRVVLEASLEVRSAVVYGSVIVVLVFMPVFFLTGLSGAFFRPLASAYVLAILASLLVALTVTPALALLLLPGATEKHAESRLVQALKVRYRRILPAVVAKPNRVIAGMLLAVVVAGGCLPLLGEEFMPKFKEYDFLMHWVEKPGTSLAAMRRITERVSKELRAIPGVRNFGSHIGRAEAADEVVGPNFTELWISLDPEADYEPAVAKIREVIAGYPGLFRDVLTYLKERIKEVLTGASGSIVVRIFGPDLEQLYAHSEIVAAEMRQVRGVVDLHVEQQVLVPQLVVRLKPGSADQFGLTSGHVRRAATTLVQGAKVGEVYEDQKTFDVVVLGLPEVRTDLEKLAELRIDTPSGAQVELGEVADVFIAPTPNTIKRESASRRIDVICNVGDRALGSVAKEIEARVRNLPFAQGYHPEFLGEYVEQQKARNRLLGLAALSILGIFLVLNTDFRSLRLTFLVFLSLPFALIGGVAAVLLGGGVISLGSVVGFVTVLGIASRNGIMLMSHYRFLQIEEGLEFGKALALRGAEERLAPILMTALTTMLALLPIVVGGNRPGYEIEHPMALVILGGLVTSTLLNLFLIPALYARFGVPAVAGEAETES
jgi:Cu/Ag efflux pump CusA